MSFQVPITIKKVIQSISENKYLLPAIQREFVWTTYQIETLFDSLMCDYPIGSFLFWEVNRNSSNNYHFYNIIDHYHEKHNKHNRRADIRGTEHIIAILDGQQRFTSLYIGLKGTYAYKLPRKRWDNDDAFPRRKLYLNLLTESDDTEMNYEFRFLSEDDLNRANKDKHWFEVGKILDFSTNSMVYQYLMNNKIKENFNEGTFNFAENTIFKLFKVVHELPIINYYKEEDENLDKVLNIFIRVNSGGTQLSYSDLLLSIASAQWKEKDAREVITSYVDEINNIGDGFDFDKDFVLKSCLVLNDITNIAFKVNNFNKKNTSIIESNWNEVSEALRVAIKLFSSMGYNRYRLPSNYTVIPVAYYLKQIGIPSNYILSSKYIVDRKAISLWLARTILRRFFGGQPDTVLRPLRKLLKSNNSKFPLEEITSEFKGKTKTLNFADDDIENLFQSKYRQSYTFSVLSLLYPTLDFKNNFHEDHIHPQSMFTYKRLLEYGIHEEDIDFYLENFNLIANIQLLEGTLNVEKSNMPFNKWFNQRIEQTNLGESYCEKHQIPFVDFDLNNFKEFIIERKKLIGNKLRDVLF